MSSYKGLYVQRRSDNQIYNVQVEDPFGNELGLTPEVYINRQIEPPIDELPDNRSVSPVVLALHDWVRGKLVSGQALYKMHQFGFLVKDEKGRLFITPGGQQALQDNGLG